MRTPSSDRDRPSAGWVDPRHLPYPLVVAGAWSGRFILLVIAVGILLYGLSLISFIVIPLAVAALLAVLLYPLASLLGGRLRLPRVFAALTALILMIVAVIGSVSLAGAQIITGAQGMRQQVEEGLSGIVNWLADGPLAITGDQLVDMYDQAVSWVQDNAQQISSGFTSGAIAAGSTAFDFLAGLLIALIATFFFLYQGGMIWRFLLSLLPHPARQPVYQAFRRGWVSLGAYARTQVIVAAVDATGIGLGALILGLPFVVPLTLLVFISAFIPIVGAVASGAVAVIIALVVEGPITALIMLAIVIGVQQLESNALQPFLMGKAVALHPLAVLLAVAAGSFLFGIVGALFSVPVLAVANSAVRYLVGEDMFPELGDGPMPPVREGSTDPKSGASHEDAVEDGTEEVPGEDRPDRGSYSYAHEPEDRRPTYRDGGDDDREDPRNT